MCTRGLPTRLRDGPAGHVSRNRIFSAQAHWAGRWRADLRYVCFRHVSISSPFVSTHVDFDITHLPLFFRHFGRRTRPFKKSGAVYARAHSRAVNSIPVTARRHRQPNWFRCRLTEQPRLLGASRFGRIRNETGDTAHACIDGKNRPFPQCCDAGQVGRVSCSAARLARLFQSLAAFVGQCPSCSVSDLSAVLAAVESKAERG